MYVCMYVMTYMYVMRMLEAEVLAEQLPDRMPREPTQDPCASSSLVDGSLTTALTCDSRPGEWLKDGFSRGHEVFMSLLCFL